ncbi:MAG: endonuclease V, partial [Minicystis sp.]
GPLVKACYPRCLMIAAVDVCYQDAGPALAACVLFRDWPDAQAARTLVEIIDHVLPYEPGAFYKRELPCVLQVLRAAAAPLDAVVIDGYVWLSDDGRPGLGAHLFEALGEKTPIVGVAKTSFMGSAFAESVLRGGSTKPLFITAAGVPPSEAAGWIHRMSGPHRLPSLLKQVDRLCRRGS